MYDIFFREYESTDKYTDYLLHSDITSDKRFKVLKPKLIMEVNKAGSLTFTVPIRHKYYGKIKKMIQEVRVEQEGEEIWAGRITSIKEDYYKNKQITCEGELSYLNDAVIAGEHTFKFGCYPEGFVRGFLNTILFRYNRFIHNSSDTQQTAVGGFDKAFSLGRASIFWDGITLTDQKIDIDAGTDPSYLKVLNSIIEAVDAVCIVRKESGVRKLDFLNKTEGYNVVDDADARIDFGENLLDYVKTWSFGDDLYTVLIPLGDAINAEDYDDEKIYSPGDYVKHYIGYAAHVHKCKYLTVSSSTPVFSTSVAYSKNAQVIYSNSLYKCKEATGPGEWDSSKWDKQKIPWNANKWWGEIILNGTTNRLTIATPDYSSLDDAMRYYNDTIRTAITKYGVIEKIVEFPADQRNLLIEQAEVYVQKTLGSRKWEEAELEISAVDLHQYMQSGRSLKLLDKVHVVSIPHGLDAYFPVDKIEIPIDEPGGTKYTLNKQKHINTLSGSVASLRK